MAIHMDLTELERFLLATPNDTEDDPWMRLSDLQVLNAENLRASLRLHAERARLGWYVTSYLKIVKPRPGARKPLEVASDLMLVEALDRLRDSWNIADEGKSPHFVLEVAAEWSWKRDMEEKPLIYEWMGVAECAIFAPERRDGSALFGFRRDEPGHWVAWPPDEQGVLRSRALGGIGLFVEDFFWLRAIDDHGNRLPTPLEEAKAAIARREAAEADVARLRDEPRRPRAREGDRPASGIEELEAEATRLREELRRVHGERS